jgi:hypothetical protein
MPDYKALLTRILDCHRLLDDCDCPDVDSQFTPATEAEVCEVEARLGHSLPPSYREFVLAVNGCAKLGMALGGLLPVTQIRWFREQHEDWIRAYIEPASDLDDVTKEEHVANANDSSLFRRAYLPELLQIGDVYDGSVYLLNPMVTTLAGEWEAWSFANWYPGAYRKPSFRDLVLSEHEHLTREVHLRSIPVDESQVMNKAIPFLRDRIAHGVSPSQAVSEYLTAESDKDEMFAAWMRTRQPYYALLEALGYHR